MKKFTSAKQKKGEYGEYVACVYLSRSGFRIIERNFTRKCGEIDIIAEKGGIFHFIEVKSVSREIDVDISRETNQNSPEENMHPWKQMKMARTISVYLASHNVLHWQCDLVCIYLDDVSRKARVTFMTDIILEN